MQEAARARLAQRLPQDTGPERIRLASALLRRTFCLVGSVWLEG